MNEKSNTQNNLIKNSCKRVSTCDGEKRCEEEELHNVPGGADWGESRAADVFMTLGDNTEQVGGAANSTHCHSTDSLAELCHTLAHCHTVTLSHCHTGSHAQWHTGTLSHCRTVTLSNTCTLAHCHTGTHAQWHSGTLSHCCTVTLSNTCTLAHMHSGRVAHCYTVTLSHCHSKDSLAESV